MPTEARIRILLCSSSMNGGGSERQLLYLLQGLDRKRFEPLLYLFFKEGALLESVPQDIPIFAFWSDRRKPFLQWPGRMHHQYIDHLSDVIREQRIDLTYDRLFHMTLVSGPATRKNHCPRVSTIVSPPEFDLQRREERWQWIKRRRLARAYRESTALLSVSQGTAEAASTFYNIPKERFQIVPSPLDIAGIDRKQLEPLPDVPWDQNLRHILSVGRLSAEKGHADLLDAFGLLVADHGTSYRLHLVGDGPLKSALMQQADRLGIAPFVHFHGHLNNPYPLMRQCDLLVLPSHYEGLPNVMLEAMVCRCPVLATETQQGAGEFLRKHPFGRLVPVKNPKAMAAAMADRFSQEPLWTSVLDEAEYYTRHHHGLSHWIETLSGLFENIAKAPKS